MPAEPVIHVIDDDEAVRDSLGFLLEAANLTVKTYDSATRFLAQLPGVEPGCIVTDIRMPEMTGLELTHRLNALGVRLPVIVITGHADVALAVEAMRAGVADFIEKPFDDKTMLAALHGALNRGQDQREPSAERGVFAQRLASLSMRERQVLDGLVAGQSNKTVALALAISPRTVEVYRANLMSKMKAESLSELVRMALIAEGPL
jgi:two-component system response regulator FixJ